MNKTILITQIVEQNEENSTRHQSGSRLNKENSISGKSENEIYKQLKMQINE